MQAAFRAPAMVFSADTARPGQILLGRRPCLPSTGQGWPSYAAGGCRGPRPGVFTDAENRRADERQTSAAAPPIPNIFARRFRDVAEGSFRMKQFQLPTGKRWSRSRLAHRRPTPMRSSSLGGTNLVDLMKLEIETPAHLVDIGKLPPDWHRRHAGGAGCASAPRAVTNKRAFAIDNARCAGA